MSKLRSVNTAFWSDPFIEDCTPSEKLLFLYLITNEKTNMLGIYEASISKMSFETGLNKDTIAKALERFQTLRKVKYIGNHIVLMNYAKHQRYNENMMKSAIDIFNQLPTEVKGTTKHINREKVKEGFQSLLNHLGTVSKVEDEAEVEIEDEIEVENESLLTTTVPPDGVDHVHFYIAKSFHNVFLRKGTNRTLQEAKVHLWVNEVRLLLQRKEVNEERLMSIAFYFDQCSKGVKGLRVFWYNTIMSVSAIRKKDKDGVYYYDRITQEVKRWLNDNPEKQQRIIQWCEALKEKVK